MEFLAGYGSDDEDHQPLKRVKHGDVGDNVDASLGPVGAQANETSVGPVGRGSREVSKSKRPALPRTAKASTWAKSSGFLAPIAYDKQDVVDDDDDDDDDDEQDTGVKLTSVGGGRPSLSQYLPAPIHETNDKSDGKVVRESLGAMEREQEVARPVPADHQVGVNPAPVVGGWHASAPTPHVHEGIDALAGILPAGVNLREISGADLRGDGTLMGGEGSGMRAALGAEYDNKLRAEAARVGCVSKLAKRKNQLSSLFQSAKSQEIEQMEKQASGAKSKVETQKKYGW